MWISTFLGFSLDSQKLHDRITVENGTMDFNNKTKCPLLILRPLFEQVAYAIGIDTTQNLIVKITQGRSHRISGVAYRGGAVGIKLVLPIGVRFSWSQANKKWLATVDPLELAYSFWRIVAHK